MKAFITVIGEDKVGIIYGVTGVLKEANVNVLDITQTLVDNYFTMIMFVDLTNMKSDFKELKASLDDVGDKLGVSIKIQHKDIFDSMHTI
ncbi:ACT domain-containing protein [Clostridium sp. SYSU_GA19001]|uniref:ACT domain-containing protein n=1 Tax=Clostridium caldaquaticum TaxID=2940653 RepID=UPI0020774E11|nr:ACT domain-containing protein [Clostridium caldaquaticum]MCM8709578.1 ACT domain-containing protein [Clostridium caldaquaticum]